MENEFIKKLNTSTNMDETQKRSGTRIQKQPKFAINLGRGGGGGVGIGIGVGIILVGGALTTAALVANAFHKKQSKKNNNNENTPPPVQQEDNIINLFEKETDQTYDFNSNLLGPSYIHHHLISTSDGMNKKTSESGDEVETREISTQNLLQDVKCDDDEHKSNEGNDSVVQTEKELSSDSLLRQSTAEDISCIAVELQERIDGIWKTNANIATQESHQPMQSLSIEEISDRDQESYSNADANDDLLVLGSKTNVQGDEDNISGANECQVDVTLTVAAIEVESLQALKGENQPETPEDKIHAQIIETGEAFDEREAQNEVQIDTTESEIDSGSKLNECHQDSKNVLDAVELLKAPRTEVFEEKQAQDSTVPNAAEEEVEENETQHDVQTDATGQVILDQGCNHEVFDADELLEAPKTIIQPETPEVIEDKFHAQIIATEDEVQIDTTGSELDSGIEQTSKLNECQSTVDQDSSDAGILDVVVESLKEPKTENQTNETVEVTEEDIEEKETQHDVQTDEARQVILDELDDLLEATKTKILLETQYDFQINAAGEVSEDEKDRYGNHVNAAEDNIHAQIIGTGLETDSGSEQTSELNECQAIVDQDSNQTNETVEVIEENEAQYCTVTNATEEDNEEKETQHDVQTDASGQLIVDQGSNHEEFDAHELLEAPESIIQLETHTVQEKEAQYDVQINAVGEKSEEKKDQHDVKVNAVEVIEENEAQDCTITNAKEEEVEGKETEHDVQTVTARAFGTDELLEASNNDQHDAQRNEALVVVIEEYKGQDIVINATEEEFGEKEPEYDVKIDAAGQVILDQGCNHEVYDVDELPETRSVEGKEAVQINAAGEKEEEKNNQYDARMNAVEVAQDYTVTKEEEVEEKDTHAAVEAQLIHQETEKSPKEFHDTSPILSAIDTIIEDHLANVKKGSEGSVKDSLVESTSEAVLTAGLVQVTKEEIVIMDEKEKLLLENEVNDESCETINDEKESSNMNLGKAKLGEQKEGVLMRNRAPIVIGTMSAVLCPLCHWYFGLPLVNICLIAALVILLSKILQQRQLLR